MDDTAIASTGRLVLRPWRDDDAQVLLAIRRRHEVARWLSDPAPWRHLDTARRAIDAWSRRPPPLGAWAIVPSELQLPVGGVHLRRLPDDVAVSVGWYLHPEATGRGYATETASCAIQYAFRTGIDRVWALMWPDNVASIRVARRAGMTDLGRCPDPWYGTADEPDAHLFRADRPDAPRTHDPAEPSR
jgi:RimJ/RimL family protein N-acetyltransferase